MNGLLEAMSLLTRVPTKAGADLARGLPWFPIVGCLVGLAVACVYAIALFVMPSFVAATLAVAAGILLTGALHEDGLADTADAFGAHVDRARTFEILKDPRLGTFGVIALVLSILLRIATLSALSRWAALAALIAAHTLGRAGALAVMRLAPAAAPSGLGADYARGLNRRALVMGLSATVAISAGALGVWSFPAVAIATGSALGVARVSTRRIGGVTGDVLGACEQLTEIGVLLLAVALADRIPWWVST